MEKRIQDFLESDLTESEFFNLSSDDLITLKDYLLEMRAKDEEFKELIKEPLNSMKDKCGWINSIGYFVLNKEGTGEYILSSIPLFTVDGRTIIVDRLIDSGEYKSLSERIPKVYLLNSGVRTDFNRQKELIYIQDELREIDLTGRSFYGDSLRIEQSVSGNFKVSYRPNLTMSLWGQDEVLATYPVRKMKEYEKPYLDEEGKKKILTRVQLRKKEEIE